MTNDAKNSPPGETAILRPGLLRAAEQLEVGCDWAPPHTPCDHQYVADVLRNMAEGMDPATAALVANDAARARAAAQRDTKPENSPHPETTYCPCEACARLLTTTQSLLRACSPEQILDFGAIDTFDIDQFIYDVSKVAPSTTLSALPQTPTEPQTPPESPQPSETAEAPNIPSARGGMGEAFTDEELARVAEELRQHPTIRLNSGDREIAARCLEYFMRLRGEVGRWERLAASVARDLHQCAVFVNGVDTRKMMQRQAHRLAEGLQLGTPLKGEGSDGE